MNLNYLKVLATVGIAVLLTGATAHASETDARIESSAKQSYVFKTFLETDSIHIQAKDGVVTLTGTVAEESHKSLAENTVANLPGVKKVHDKLKIQGTHPATDSDAWIGVQVKLSLLFNRHVSGLNTQISVSHGIVTLRGEAGSDAQKELTAEYAKDINGVKEVKNEMTIAKNPSEVKETLGEKIDDASITAQVKLALMVHRSTSALMTGVTTTNGVVTLSGYTSSESKKDMAAKVAGHVKGVDNVVNHMTIRN